MSKKYDVISKFINQCRTHYLKWDLTHDISVRYHFLHQSNRDLEGQFIIKLHKEGTFNIVERDFAKKLILSYKQSTEAPNTEEELSKPDWEITGRRIKCPLTGKMEYLKTIINYRTNETHFGIDVNIGFKEMSYGPDGELMFKEKDVAGIPCEYGWREHYDKMLAPKVKEESIDIQPIRIPDANELPPIKWLDDYAKTFDNNISSDTVHLAKKVYDRSCSDVKLNNDSEGLLTDTIEPFNKSFVDKINANSTYGVYAYCGEVGKITDIAADAKIEGEEND